MAKPLTDYLGEMKLRWVKVENTPTRVASCSFCHKDIMSNDYYLKLVGMENAAGKEVFTLEKPDIACSTCAKSVGLVW